jgi:uncharacterized damage-inducible protein DinB
MVSHLSSPSSDEYAPYYEEYVQRAIARQNVVTTLPLQIDELRAALSPLTDEQARFRFGPKEWSIKEVLGHMIDVERIFSYRLLRIARADPTPLSGFEDEQYVREAGFDHYALQDLLDEFAHLRRANSLAVKNMSEDAILRRGTASNAPFSARALIYILIGHVDHHMACLHEKYLPAL